MGLKNQGHRSGSLKQTNKGHKTGGHRSKRAIEQDNRGRVNVKQSTMKQKRELRREERRHQANQVRKNKRQDAIALKRELGTANSAPFLTCILSLHESIDPLSALAILEGCDEEAVITKTKTVTHISLPRLKQRFSFIVPAIGKHNELQVLDYLKVCDSTLLLISASTEDAAVDRWGTQILAMATAQGIPTPMVALMDLASIAPKKRSQVKIDIQKQFIKYLPSEKVMTFDTNSDGLNLFRRIGGQKRNLLANKTNRPHLYGESFEHSGNVLQVTGFLRGKPLSVNGLVHIPGLGDFQISQIDAPSDPYKQDVKIRALFPKLADPAKQQSLQRENIPDEMDAEQTWPTQDEILASKEENKKSRLIKRIPKGMSDYQAAWIPDIEEVDAESDDDDVDDDDEENEDQYMSCGEKSEDGDDEQVEEAEIEEKDDSASMMSEDEPVNDEAYDKIVDMDEDKTGLEKIKAAQEEKRFPDEIDTPQNVPARIRFQKYRGLESFRTSPWDAKENLPYDYARIFQFANFDRAKKQFLKRSDDDDDDDNVQPGTYIKIHVAGVTGELWAAFQSANNYVILYGLLPHENEMSVMNVVLKRTPGSEIPIKSKERIIMQCGFRRFIVNPIFSQHTNGDKHKYERFFRSEDTVVATFYAPIQFPPAPILCFMENPNTTLSLVASGRLISCNPDRIILKRVILSGHPFKIHRKSATIRYMFFNKEDIAYYKPCKLRTKCGQVGHIKESLGTHGHMKCVFDKPIKSFDTVFLQLYKRIYPKWTYEDCVVHTSNTVVGDQKMES